MITKISRRKLFWGTLLIFLTLLGFLVFWPENEPVVDGQTITSWALRYGQGRDTNCALPLQKSGRAAVAPLARLLQARELPWVKKFILWTRAQSWVPLHLVTAEEKRAAGLYGLSVIGSNAAPMLGQIAAYKPPSNFVEQNALDSLVGSYARKEIVPRAPPYAEILFQKLYQAEIFRIDSIQGPRYVAMGSWFGKGGTDSSFISISLLDTNAVRLDWIEVDRLSREGVLCFLTKARLARTPIKGYEGYEIIVANGSSSGFAQWQIRVASSNTNRSLMFTESNGFLGIRIQGDRFELTATNKTENPNHSRIPLR